MNYNRKTINFITLSLSIIILAIIVLIINSIVIIQTKNEKNVENKIVNYYNK